MDSAARYRPAGHPSVRSVSSPDLDHLELHPGRAQEQIALALVEAEVGDAELLQRPVRPPAAERQCRRLPARDRDLRAGGHVLEQRGEHVEAGRIADQMEIVEHEHQRAPGPASARPT